MKTKFNPVLLSIMLILFISCSMATVAGTTNIAKTSDLLVSDGPYVTKNNGNATLNWICDNEVNRKVINNGKFPINFDQCELNAKVRLDAATLDEISYSGDFNIAATSDFHGQYALMKSLLVNNNIIDKQGNWAFGNGHFVITGDIFDRGDKVTEILWFIYHLEKQAERAGGKVHLLLGNHEVMVLNGDLRYLHPKYMQVATLLNQPFEQLFENNTVLGQWLRSKSVLVKINDMLFAHGGFHPDLAKEKRTLTEINQVFKKNLIKRELPEARQGFGQYVHKTHGPIWYRGYFKDNGATAEEIELLLTHFDVKHIVVGHTSQKQVETRFKGRVIAIDSSIKRGEYGELLLIENNKKWRGTLSGEKIPLY